MRMDSFVQLLMTKLVVVDGL